MPLQNRVDPKGDIIFTSARGAWLGNRGVIHNKDQKIIRPYKIKAWIICMLEFRGRHRRVMTENRWTELFFLDEATAFSAGHRPCFQCRYADHKSFKTAWLRGNHEYGFDENTSITEIDNVLRSQRVSHGCKVIYEDSISNLPDGTFVLVQKEPWLLAEGMMRHWTPFGYNESKPACDQNFVPVLTPRSIVNAFRAGYKPQIKL